MQKIDGPRINLIVDQELLDKIDKFAKHLGTTRSEMMRVMLETCCDGLEPYYKLGILKKMFQAKFKFREKVFGDIQPELL